MRVFEVDSFVNQISNSKVWVVEGAGGPQVLP